MSSPIFSRCARSVLVLRRATGLACIATGVIALVAAISGSRADPVGRRQVTFDRLRTADSDPANWLTYSGQYNGQRYSRLDAISRRTVRHLNVTWIYQPSTTRGRSS